MPKRLKPSDGILWYETNKFKQIAKKWNKKLVKSGFDDKEDFGSIKETLKDYHNHHFTLKYTHAEFEEKRRYYELATQLVHEYPFKLCKDRDIWIGHIDGLTEIEISKKHRCTVYYVKKTIKTVRLAIKRDAKDILHDLDAMKESND